MNFKTFVLVSKQHLIRDLFAIPLFLKLVKFFIVTLNGSLRWTEHEEDVDNIETGTDFCTEASVVKAEELMEALMATLPVPLVADLDLDNVVVDFLIFNQFLRQSVIMIMNISRMLQIIVVIMSPLGTQQRW